MLAVAPSASYLRLGMLLSALIICASTIGLTMHRDFYAGRRRKDFFCFYTNLSNLLVLVYFALIAPRLYSSPRLRPLVPHAEFSLMMSIMLTFCVFHLLIFPPVFAAARHAARTREFYIVLIDNAIVHYLVPWLVFLYWLLCSPGKAALRAADGLLWTLIPAAYLVCIMAGANRRSVIEEAGSVYPYPFLDVAALGGRRVAIICAALYGVCAAAGLTIVAVLRGMIALLGAGHAFILI